ncbi:MAG: arsinothricin resistance N-acetyltransferase ArsN1 [Thermoplasmata archaeon]|nr:arsinothricin resistance N-acetyltransferase ArsN1 [Thermoplasmata archaeon]
MFARPATPNDSAEIARIYNEGIRDRIATFETRARSVEEIRTWFDGKHPIVVVDEAGGVVGFAGTSIYRPRDCYASNAEFSVYVERSARGRGVGKAALVGLIDAARAAQFHKLISRVFPENLASLRLVESVGFRRVGIYAQHGRLDGVWRDVVIVELLL